MTRDVGSVYEELKRGFSRLTTGPAGPAGLGACGCLAVGDLLVDEAGVDLLMRASRVRVVVACDPGVQSGYVLAASADGEVVPVASWVLGRRATKDGRSKVPPRPPRANDHATVLRAALELCDGWLECPSVLVCEDWFTGPNPGTVRDTAQHYYFSEAAAQGLGLVFRSVMHSTWKKSYVGRGNMPSAQALAAYAARGFKRCGVPRWDPAGEMELCDDAAALGCATWYLETEAT